MKRPDLQKRGQMQTVSRLYTSKSERYGAGGSSIEAGGPKISGKASVGPRPSRQKKRNEATHGFSPDAGLVPGAILSYGTLIMPRSLTSLSPLDELAVLRIESASAGVRLRFDLNI